jgi:hypothetical protein
VGVGPPSSTLGYRHPKSEIDSRSVVLRAKDFNKEKNFFS